MTAPAELTPVPLTSEDEAGSLWRGEKLRDFAFRLRSLGLEGDPACAALLAQIAQDTATLEELAQQQKRPDYQRPWWADGEYDAARADRANDEGQALHAAGRHSAAFDAFTEAIRLRPTSAVYHANRAAAALRLGRPAIAAEDADEAARRDPTYLRAHLRGGRARLQLGQPLAAAACFRAALAADASSTAAAKGLTEAAAMEAAQQRQADAEAEAAQRGARPGLPRGEVPEEQAVLQLHSAEQMLAANPRLQAARAARVEALLLCQRYTDAEAACASLLEGSADRLYLQAEAAWRQGDLPAAAEALRQALRAAGPTGGSAKCSSLLAHVRELLGLQEEAVAALEEGAPQRCLDACADLLAKVHPRACTGLACATLHRRAEAQAARQAWPAAVAELDAALALDAGHAACLWLRAEAHKQAGSYTACFLDLRRLKKVAPGTPGLLAALEEVARLGLGGGGARGSSTGAGGGGGTAARAGGDGAAEEALRVLGLPGSATTAQARRAYLQLAAKWHPDKWAAAGSEEEQRAAGDRFKHVQRAWELLAGGE